MKTGEVTIIKTVEYEIMSRITLLCDDSYMKTNKIADTINSNIDSMMYPPNTKYALSRILVLIYLALAKFASTFDQFRFAKKSSTYCFLPLGW